MYYGILGLFLPHEHVQSAPYAMSVARAFAVALYTVDTLLCRVLRVDGWALIDVPCFSNGNATKDCRGVLPEERVNCTGDKNHVWKFDCEVTYSRVVKSIQGIVLGVRGVLGSFGSSACKKCSTYFFRICRTGD